MWEMILVRLKFTRPVGLGQGSAKLPIDTR